MKTLYLMRHGAPRWFDMGAPDYDRPLSLMGERQSSLMGEKLVALDWYPDKIISSSAKRARNTAASLAEQLEYPYHAISKTVALYHTSLQEHQKEVQHYLQIHDSLLVVGHRFALGELIFFLTKKRFELPPAGIALLVCESVADICREEGAKLFLFDFPKNDDGPKSLIP